MVQALTKIPLLQVTKCYKKGLKKHAITVLTGSQVRHLKTKELVFSKFGEPLEVVTMRESELSLLGAHDVLVRMLAAPVNPADIYAIQGLYPIPLALPCVAGNEGVGVVEQIGCYVTKFCPGNKVVITTPCQGTWRKYAVFHQCMLYNVPEQLGIAEAATLTVNPCTAYRLLNDFKPVRECCGVVIQNGANSSCGQNVIQLCNAWGLQSINIVRKRSDMGAIKSQLCSLGATYVMSEEELKTTNIFKENYIAKPCLALNCVGGKNATQMMRQLERGGCMVTYGGLSRQPVTIPTTAFIFKNLAFRGFWMTGWNCKSSQEAQDAMLTEILSLMVSKQLIAPAHKMVKFDKYAFALCKTLKAFQGNKYILDFT